MNLSQRQRQILAAMRDHGDGLAAFGRSYMRSFSIGLAELNGELVGGVLVRAYQQPEFFLESRKLIRSVERNVPGRWFELTPQGREIAGRLKTRSEI